MKKLIYIEDNFLDSSLCQPFIDLYDINKESVTFSSKNKRVRSKLYF